MLTGINRLSQLTVAHMTPSVNAAPSARVGSNSHTATPPGAVASTKVIFGSQSEEIAAVYDLSAKKVAPGQGNPEILALMNTVSASNSVSALSGLGSALLSNLESNPGDISQSISGTSLAAGVSGATKSAVTLNIVTQTGSTVHLTLSRQNDGLAVEVKTEGKSLNKDEAEAVANLSRAFGKTLDGLGREPPELDIGDLTQFNSNLLKSVDLKTDMRRGDTTLQSLNFHADASERWVAYEDQNFSLKMTSDIASQTLPTSYSQQQLALKAWDNKLDKARTDGHGDLGQMAAMKSVFRALNSTVSAQSASPTEVATIRSGASRLSGLNDFSLSLTQADKSLNPARSDEKQSFAYQASQNTQEIARNDGSKSIRQTNRSHLSASWYTALDPATPLSLSTTKSSQNYYYHMLENDEESTTTLNYNSQGALASVGQHEKVDNRETVKKYVLGELVDETITPLQYEHNKILRLLAIK
ncbi:hypothetical protein [Vagococcus sp. WN89Y]|uniref:hypothetical protein n=1 Tax=Vagococcus sp. WN89Y TaxID=3457258 RepID=UPI003FCD0EB1